MSCFLISWCGARANELEKERELARECACVRGRSVGRVVCSLGKVCLFATTDASILRKRGRELERRARSECRRYRRKVPRKYEGRSAEYIFCSNTVRSALCWFLCSLSRDCERTREWGSSKVQRCAVCSTLSNASPHILLLLLPPAAFSLDGVVF